MAGQQVQSITVQNQGGFTMTFWISYDGPDGKVHWSENNSGDYPREQDRTLDLSKCHTNDPKNNHTIPLGATVWATVKIDLGKQIDGPKVVYGGPNNGHTAVYKVWGATLTPSIALIG
jgi:hypothetical protein